MHISLKKKFLHPFVLGLIVLVGSFGAYSLASAKFIVRQEKFHANGTITDLNAARQTITFDTVGTEPSNIYITPQTVFVDGLTFADLSVGDRVDVMGFKGPRPNDDSLSQKIATQVKRLVHDGYGGNGDGDFREIFLNDAIVVSKSGNSTLTVRQTRFNPTTFVVDNATVFNGKTFAQLKTGDHVKVVGTNTGTNFLAKTVTFMDSGSNE